MVDNKLFPTSVNEAIDAVELNTLNAELSAISMRVRFNPDISVHKFITNFEFDDEWLIDFVKMANTCEHTRKLLVEAKIRL